jgi:hypothetical protein
MVSWYRVGLASVLRLRLKPLFPQTYTFQIDLSIKEDFTFKGESCQQATGRPFFHHKQTLFPPLTDPSSTTGRPHFHRWKWGLPVVGT